MLSYVQGKCSMSGSKVSRGYYIAAWGYKISLRVLKNISWLSAANEWNIVFNMRREILYLQATM